MRKAVIPFVLVASTLLACGGGESAIEGAYNDCATKYEAWEKALGDVEDEESAADLFNEIMDWEKDSNEKVSGAWDAIADSMHDAEGKERESKYDELTDMLEDPQKDCLKARIDFAEELKDKEDACKGWGDWAEAQAEAWEDYDDARKDYEEDCKDDCAHVGVSKYWNDVPGPEGLSLDRENKFDSERCED